jgi:hypothetical protein
MIDPAEHPDPPLGMPDPPRDWFEFWVRFTCGALFGLFMGGLFWLRYFWRLELGWLVVPFGSLAWALAAARFGDNFWTSLRILRGFRWWW